MADLARLVIFLAAVGCSKQSEPAPGPAPEETPSKAGAVSAPLECASFDGKPCAKDSETGQCAQGVARCLASGRIECVTQPAEAVDQCDGLDRNCDGVAGERCSDKLPDCFVGTGRTGEAGFERTRCWAFPHDLCTEAGTAACAETDAVVEYGNQSFCCTAEQLGDALPAPICRMTGNQKWQCRSSA